MTMRSSDAILAELCGGAGESSGMSHFFSDHYRRHNSARLAHLDSLGLPLDNRTVLEVGSGPGDHTEFYLSRGCQVLAVDVRRECLDTLQRRFPGVRVACIDMNRPAALAHLGAFEVVHCYGLLYHLENPGQALEAMAQTCSGILVLETCVHPGAESTVNTVAEDARDFTQAASGRACRPTRRWVFSEIKRHFEFVYQTRTQPDHPEFPLDWTKVEAGEGLMRAVFVGSRHPLSLPTLSEEILERQVRTAPSPDGVWRSRTASVPGAALRDEENPGVGGQCWCGCPEWKPFHGRFWRCRNCRTIHLRREWTAAGWDPERDEVGLGGRYPWVAASAGEAAGYEHDWRRQAAEMWERNLRWLRTLLKHLEPGARVLAVASPHESIVTLMRLAGFAVTTVNPEDGEAGDSSPDPHRYDAVMAMDVIGRSPNPLPTLRRCVEQLAPEGLLVAEADCLDHGELAYADMVMINHPLLPDIQRESIGLVFTPEAIGTLVGRLGLPSLALAGLRLGRRMAFVAGRGDLHARTGEEAADLLLARQDGRVVLALQDVAERLAAEKQRRREAETDRAALAESLQEARDAHKQAQKAADERLVALTSTDAELKMVYREAELRAQGMIELTAALKEREGLIGRLQRAAEERLHALMKTDDALKRERSEREKA